MREDSKPVLFLFFSFFLFLFPSALLGKDKHSVVEETETRVAALFYFSFFFFSPPPPLPLGERRLVAGMRLRS